jgi:gliding motility-associated-like protein
MFKKFTFLFLSLIGFIALQAQPLNDGCITATPITIPASGNVCVTGTTVGATTTTYTTAVCGQTVWTNDVWFTFVSNGSLNTITVQPTGSPAAQRVGVAVWQGGCAGLTSVGTSCDISATAGGTVTITQASAAGTQYWVQVSAFTADGGFQLCVNSATPPASPGTTCATAAPLCDLSSFTLATGPAGTGNYTPSCFIFGAASSVYYQFSVGTSGLLAFSVDPTSPLTELDWAVFDVTNGCGTANLNNNTVACNYSYNGQASNPVGMSPTSTTVCPTSAGTGNAANEFCPSITVTAGRTYVILIDNFSNNSSGWDFNFTGSTFQMAPTSAFTLNTNKICGTSGSVTITNSSVGAASQTWNFGDGSPTSNAVNPGSHNYTSPGTYIISLAITSATGCTDVSTQSIQIIAPPVLTPINDTICAGGQATVGVSANPSGGTYAWNPGAFNTATFNVSPANTTPYTVLYTSPDNCTANATATVTVSASNFVVNAGPDSVICNNQTITLNGTVTPVGTYTYLWSPAPNNGGNTLNPTVSPSVSTLYTLSVTDAAGCSKTDDVQIGVSGVAVPVTATAVPAIICPGQPVQLDCNILPVTCGASPPCNGNVFTPFIGTDSTVQPGTSLQPPTLFGNFLRSGRNQMLYTAAELGPALGGPCIIKALTFWIKVFNSNAFLQNFTIKMACTNLASLTTWEQNLTTVYTSPNYQPQAGILNGIALTTPFAWDGTSNIIIDICWNNPSTFGNQNNKAACTNTAFTSYLYSFSSAADQCGTSTAPSTSTLRPNVRFNYCAPNLNNYTIVWTPSTGANAVSNPAIHDPTTNPIVTTNYNVSIANGGCAGNGVVTVQVDNSTLTAGPDKNSCPNAQVPLIATVGGTILPGPATFVWTTLAGANVGNNDTVNVTPSVTTTYIVTMNGGACVKRDTITVNIGSLAPTATPSNATCFGVSNGSILAASASGTTPFTYTWSANAATGNLATASNLAPGSYQVTVSDATGCTGSATASIIQPTQVTFTSATVNDSCFGETQGSITLTPNGGTGGYTYAWSNSLPATQTVNNLAANTYTVTVRDANSCSATASIVITEPTQIVFGNAAIQDVRCFNGNTGVITVTNSGGTGAFTYDWSHSGSVHTSTASNLTAGAYTVTAIDANGCTASNIYNVAQPATGLTVSITNVVNPSCNSYTDGSATATPNGGVGTLDYLWTPSNQTTQTATNLSAIQYTVLVTDDSSCTATATVTPVDPAAIQITGVITNVKCFGGSDGAVNVTVTNGVPNLSYAWSYNSLATEDISGLPLGNYTLSVTDANSCSAVSSFSITEPAALILNTPSITDVLCFGGNTGAITAIHTGGTGPFVYTWSPAGPNSATNSSLIAGNYSVTVVDVNACSVSAAYVVTQPVSALSFGAPVVVDELCNGASTGSITVNVSGGNTTSAYTYSWSHNAGLNNSTASNLPAATYIVTVTDVNGCSLSSSNTVNQPTAVIFGNQTITNVSCFGGNDGSATITPTGGTGAYTYTWNGVSGSNPQNGLVANTYTVVVTDANNCPFTTTVTVTEPAQIIVAPTATDALCFGANNGTVNSNVSGGSLPYSYVWSNAAVTQDITGVGLGLYTVTATDANGCSASGGANVNEPSSVIFNTQVTQVKCVGDKNGTITAFPSGGTPPYTYSATQDGFSTVFYPTNGIIEGLASGFYVVLVSDDNSCTLVDTVFVAAPVGDTYFITADSTSCYGADYSDGALFIVGSPIVNGPFRYGVDGGALQFSGDFYNLKAGIHSVLAVNNFGCDTTLTATVPEPVDATTEILPSDTTLDLGESIQLSSVFSPYPYSTITSYNWSPSTGLSCTDCPNPLATPYGRQTQYTLTITYNGLCTASASMTILVDGGKPVYIPNSFSPNGDGNNDVFQIYGVGIKTIDLKIFNRWGEKVYESNNQFEGWDGTYKGVIQNPAVFAYQVTITYLNDKKKQEIGSITLIR